MKNTILAFSLLLIISSCGLNRAIITNQNQNSTQVQLSSANFNVIDRVTGSASIDYYVFIFGGISKEQLYENAYAQMVEKAILKGYPRALTNIVTEEQWSGFYPIFFSRSITVSANVIEFTK